MSPSRATNSLSHRGVVHPPKQLPNVAESLASSFPQHPHRNVARLQAVLAFDQSGDIERVSLGHSLKHLLGSHRRAHASWRLNFPALFSHLADPITDLLDKRLVPKHRLPSDRFKRILDFAQQP